MSENVARGGIDNKNVLFIWIVDCLQMYNIFDKVIKFFTETFIFWKVDLKAGGTTLTEVKIE